MIDLDEQDRIKRVVGDAEVLDLYRAMLHVRQPAVGEALLPGILDPVVVGGVVEEQHVPLGADEVAEQLAVVAVRRQVVRHLHAGLDAREAQHFDRVIERVALAILGAAPGVSDRPVVDVGRSGVGAGERRRAEQGQDEDTASG